MNRQSNTYTLIYIIVLVIVVGAGLALAATSLSHRQQQNADADKIKQILASVRISAGDDPEATFEHYITDQLVVNSRGEVTGHDAFGIDVATQTKEPAAERNLPVYVCSTDNGIKYIVPVYGAGLWGPIWGYVALNDDASTIYGAYFAHQGETPGLGAEIEKPAFSAQFDGKNLFRDNELRPIAVVKKGQKAPQGYDYVDGISGGTITSKGVGAMLDNCLRPYAAYLSTLRK